jgi:hypothetical protein
VRFGNSARRLSTGVSPLTVLMLGIWAGTCNDVTSSSRRLFAVHQEAERGEEVDADEGMCDVGHHESTREIPA